MSDTIYPVQAQNPEMIKWCTTEYRLEFCKEKATELRASGEYLSVRVRKTGRFLASGGDYADFGRIYVNRNWELAS